ncbi:hypothetical protein HYH03_006182 [Edaphochlamys debaryana]|uniref:HVA22-like protein n=1 Tax=Edaphochlamys debaryana TaxID=47281 RepID=A0A836C166_9CHLO|nr:hypothetical protein HYH03_006182 [Edaphochlamys debaryana]|eukprot:KAG2495582.1 hypothetical protein HYH03_006182 [Edaphochlamys debaryana]
MVLGCAVPAYLTHKAVSAAGQQGVSPAASQQLRHWCIYWLLLGFFLCLEWLADMSIFWMPLYYEAKLVLVVAMWHPRTHVAVTLYDSYVLPLLRQNEANIDRFFVESRARVADAVTSQVTAAQGYVQNNAGVIVQSLKSFSEKPPMASGGSASTPTHAKAQ